MFSVAKLKMPVFNVQENRQKQFSGSLLPDFSSPGLTPVVLWDVVLYIVN